MHTLLVVLAAASSLITADRIRVATEQPAIPARINTFMQETAKKFSIADGLPSDEVSAIAVTQSCSVYAGTKAGLARLNQDKWELVAGTPPSSVGPICAQGDQVLFVADNAVQKWDGTQATPVAALPADAGLATCLATNQGGTLLGMERGLFILSGDQFKPAKGLGPLLTSGPKVNQIAIDAGGAVYVAADSGLFLTKTPGVWESITPSDGARSWAPRSVGGVAFDSQRRVWFASPQGVGCFDGSGWRLYTGQEGLPYNDFTSIYAGEDGSMWFGTRMGAIKYDGKDFRYKQGKRWLPDDCVLGVAVTPTGDAWFATAAGVGVIQRVSMTLSQKAAFYEDEIEKYLLRTPYGYISEVGLENPGDKSVIIKTDSDNDGLWTSMYGVGECFAYAATRDPKAKDRAKRAFEALRFLGEVTQSGSHPAPKGFVARTILPTSGPNPNEGRLQRDIKSKETDALWKIYEPRWPTSADGQWYWKSDTSSDELDGHYFFYPIYYDLVAEMEDEKAAVREHVRAITDHLIDHGFNFVDHTGTVTRWGVYDPEALSHDHMWYAERGLKSLSMLSYLAVAEHMTDDPKYGEAAKTLREKYAFDTNAMITKIARGIGSGNQSDEEMGFMCYYNLIKYTKDPKLRGEMLTSFLYRWIVEEPERNPFFNFSYAAVGLNQTFTDPWGSYDASPWPNWLDDSVDTLQRFPLDRVGWRHDNSKRIDIVPLARPTYEPSETELELRGIRTTGKCIPVDECMFNHYNYNPFELQSGGNGRELASGTVFLLPYYMGLYHGFIVDESLAK